jgi:hypothetical protein
MGIWCDIVCLVSLDALSQGLSIGATLAVVGSVLSLLRIVAVGGPGLGQGDTVRAGREGVWGRARVNG